MFAFASFLTEQKNLHMEHLEDEILNGGVEGTRAAINFLQGLRDMLAGNADSSVNVTVKWDGAPAVFAGINPENDQFFVGTKGVFAKNAKINYSHEDIDNNHSGGLAKKLHTAFDELSKVNSEISRINNSIKILEGKELELANIKEDIKKYKKTASSAKYNAKKAKKDCDSTTSKASEEIRSIQKDLEENKKNLAVVVDFLEKNKGDVIDLEKLREHKAQVDPEE